MLQQATGFLKDAQAIEASTTDERASKEHLLHRINKLLRDLQELAFVKDPVEGWKVKPGVPAEYGYEPQNTRGPAKFTTLQQLLSRREWKGATLETEPSGTFFDQDTITVTHPSGCKLRLIQKGLLLV